MTPTTLEALDRLTAGPQWDEVGAPAVCRAAGITYRKLDYWVRSGAVEASLSPSDGSGTYRIYSRGDVRRAWLIARARELRIGLESIVTRGLEQSIIDLAERSSHLADQIRPEVPDG